MEKNKKGRWVIHSLKELSESDQKNVNQTAIIVGIVVFLMYLAGFYVLGYLPKYSTSLLGASDARFDYWTDWIAVLVGGGLLSVHAAHWGLYCKLTYLGFSVSSRPWCDNSSPNPQQASFSDVSYSYSSSPQSSSMSVNTGSGLPMCGSSGMDTRGNPYGTSSW